MKNPKVIQFHHITLSFKNRSTKDFEYAKSWIRDRRYIVATRLNSDFPNENFTLGHKSDFYGDKLTGVGTLELTIKMKFKSEEEVTSFLLRHSNELRKNYYFNDNRDFWNNN